jgi:hypothetical protein
MAAYLGVLAVLVFPGALIAYLLGLHFGTLLTWAAVPLFSLAAVFVLGELTSLAGIPFGVPAFVTLIVVLGLASVLERSRSRPRMQTELFSERQEPTVETRREERVAQALLGLGVLAGCFVWWGGLRRVPLVVPGGDGSRHGYWVARIVHGESIEASSVLTLDADGVHQVGDYFPLGGHAAGAMASRLMSADIGEVLVALTVVFAAVVLPLGMFVLARFLAPERPLVAGFTALAVPALTLFPYATASDGKAFVIVSMAMVPAAVVLLTSTALIPDLPRGSPAKTILVHAPAAIALLASISVHSSEVPLTVFLVLLLVLEASWLERRIGIVFNALVRGLVVALIALVLFAPSLGAFVGGASERSSTTALGVSPETSWTDLLEPVLTLRTYFPPEGFAAALPGLPSAQQTLFAACAFVGAVIWLVHRRVAWVIGWMAVIVLSLFASTADNPIVRGLTFPWYSGSIRINWNQVFFVSFFAAVPLALAVSVAVRMLRRRSALVPATVVVLALFIAFVGFTGYRTSRSFLRSAFTVKVGTFGNQARVDGRSEAAIRWLDGHRSPNDTVVNEPRVDGSLWMYAKGHVKPLLGFDIPTSSADHAARRDWEDRHYVVRHVHELGDNERVDRLVREYRARWVYFDDRRFPVTRRELKTDSLRGNPRFSEVFRQGAVHVFRINGV